MASRLFSIVRPPSFTSAFTRSINLATRRPIVQTSFPPASIRSSSTATTPKSSSSVLKNVLYGTSLTIFVAFGYLYITDTRASVHQWLFVPALRWIFPDAEDAHEFGTKALRVLYDFGLNPRERTSKKNLENNILKVNVFGHDLQCPIGTSAGIDKHANVPDALMALGPSIVEVGGATPYPQDGNPKPRVFRLPGQKALINRYGLNSDGADDMAMRLRERVRMYAYQNGLGIDEEAERLVLDGEAGVPPGSLVEGKLLAVQVAKNKFTPADDFEAVKRDYVYCVETLARYADIIVVNVSSPNTPGLRSLQAVEPLTNILKGVVGAAKNADRKMKPKVMVKVSPDEDSEEQIEGIAEAMWRSGVDGVIVGNTTNRRTGLVKDGHKLNAKDDKTLREQGGYSGPQMFERTLGLVKRYRRLLDQGPPRPNQPETSSETPAGDTTANSLAQDTPSQESTTTIIKDTILQALPKFTTTPSVDTTTPKVIFATGGITNGSQALEILNAGASVAMVYTALIYGGVGTISRIKNEMRDEILQKGTTKASR